jgi:NADPH-dependent 2,4-dienoyl-CoA reductase/sulfur reductase-like enzyme
MCDFLIIGADAAGLSAAVQIRREKSDASMKVINKGKIISYAACGIPYVISGDIESTEKLIHFSPETFKKKRGVLVETQKEAVNIFPENKSIEVKDIKTGKIYKEKYKKLLIATGAVPNKLPFIDYDEQGIFSLSNLEDLKDILQYLEDYKPRRAAVIGAGNIGLELVEGLDSRGIDVHIFEIFPEPAMTWPSLIRDAVRKKIAEKKIKFSGDSSVKEVHKTKKGFTVEADNESYRFDMVFSVVGTKPATGFCSDKIEKLNNGALIINRKGNTSEKDIYSAGDCASVYHRILDRNVYFPLGSTANRMGRVVGLNMAGRNILFPGIVGTQIFKFFELSLAKTGLSLEEAEKEGIYTDVSYALRMNKAGYYPGAKKSKVEIVYDKSSGRILGASAVSESNAAQLIDPAAVAVFAGLNVKELGWFDAAYTPPFAPVWNAWVSASLKHKLD